MTDVRITQQPFEVVEQESVTDVRITQMPIEAVEREDTDTRLTQMPIEIVHSGDCPTFVPSTPSAGPPAPSVPVPPEEQLLRRLRRTTHMSADEMYLFFSKLQIDFLVGQGLNADSTTVGFSPQAMLRWSDDGGQTWSKEHWVTTGKIGQYSQRAIWRRLGRSRDRVFELVVTDPVKWSMTGAYFDAEQGDA